MSTVSTTLREFFDKLPDAAFSDTKDYKIISFPMLEHIVNKLVYEAEVRGETRILNNIDVLLESTL
jgi:hypothetical protein